MASASTKPEFSGIKSHKLMSGVFERKCSSDYESAWSPTSPLDFRLFSSLRNPFSGDSSSSRSIWVGKQKSWDSGKVGLSIVHSLDDDDDHIDSSRILLPSPDSKKMIFGSLIDKHNTAFEIGHDVIELQSSGFVDRYCSNTGNISVTNNGPQEMKQTSGSLTGHINSDIEISEDYTCVISHGPHPKTTHFYEVLESVERNELKNKKESIFEVAPLDFTIPIEVLPPNDFLSFCWFCNKKLDMSKDIYMYRGYKAFCSSECRLEEINQDEEEEDDDDDSSSSEEE